MSSADGLPLWVALAVSAFVLLGAGLTLTGTIGLIRFRSFYARVHAPTLGTTWGAGAILIASMIFFSAAGGRPVLHEVLIAVFLVVTTPVTLTLLVRAALYRDRAESNGAVPPLASPAEPDEREQP
jgi:multicomponent K+:H+ antiporter subunit G